MENGEITFLSHYRYVINNEDKTKPVECLESGDNRSGKFSAKITVNCINANYRIKIDSNMSPIDYYCNENKRILHTYIATYNIQTSNPCNKEELKGLVTEFLYQHFIHQASWLQLNNGINIKNPPMLCFYLHVSDKINTDFPLDLEISFIQQNSYS